MQAHGLGVASGQYERRGCPLFRTDSSEDVGRRRTLVVRRRWSSATSSPATGDLVLLTDPGFVGEPNFYLCALDTLLAGNLVHTGSEVFLNVSTAPTA